ncbi:CpaE family protein [Hyphomonas sp.]|uniref:AAA family ATPase n=1 Tax=Hyphomonas sp. TaxID=87 RepID=UPI0035677C31
MKAYCAELADLSGLSPSEIVLRHGGGLVLVEQGVAGYDQVILTLAVERPNTAVIVVSDQLPGHIVRALMKFEASDIVSGTAGIEEIIDAAEQVRETQSIQGPGATSKCWAFRGAVGGAGVSTLAIESAFSLARKVGPGKVCLVDLNVSDGMVTSFLEAVPKLDLQALVDSPDRLDQRLLAAWCWEHAEGVSLLAVPRNPDADALATEPAMLRLLDVACSTFEYVLVDMPRHMMPWTKSVLGAVDEAIVVSELTVPSLHAAADMCRETDILRRDRSKSKLVLNRMFPKKRFRAEFAVDKAEQAIEQEIHATIASDWDAARTAVNLGKPIADVKPKSQLVLDVEQFVDSLLPDEVIANEAKPQKTRRAK